MAPYFSSGIRRQTRPKKEEKKRAGFLLVFLITVV
jgi:hypothetical protein